MSEENLNEESKTDVSKSQENTAKEKSNKDNPYINNPLHGVGLKTVLHELVTHYSFDILYAHLNINCFRSNPSLAASEKFLKKTDWARQKVEVFYLYQYKNLPKVSSEQFDLPPRERIIPAHQKPSKPAILSVEDGIHFRNQRERKTNNRNSGTSERTWSRGQVNKSRDDSQNSKPRYNKSADDSNERKSTPAKDPWGNFKKK